MIFLILGKGTKAPITAENLPQMKEKVKVFKKYISGLKKKSGQLLIESQQWTGFLGLFLGLDTAIGLAKMLIIEPPHCLTTIKHVLTYRLSQDHLELFFSVVRSRSGFNPNPTCNALNSIYIHRLQIEYIHVSLYTQILHIFIWVHQMVNELTESDDRWVDE